MLKILTKQYDNPIKKTKGRKAHTNILTIIIMSVIKIPSVPSAMNNVLRIIPSNRMAILPTTIEKISSVGSLPLILMFKLNIGLKNVRIKRLIENKLNTKRTNSLVMTNKLNKAYL